MQLKANLKGIQKDLLGGGYLVTFGTSEDVTPLADMQGDLSLTVTRFTKKRSLDANAYAWVLMGKIASVLKTSKEEVYEEALRRYGVFETDEDGRSIEIQVDRSVDAHLLPGHWYRVDDLGNKVIYMMLKGSSEYTAKEMSVFIDGIISEAKELHIEALPPDELERMMKAWKA